MKGAREAGALNAHHALLVARHSRGPARPLAGRRRPLFTSQLDVLAFARTHGAAAAAAAPNHTFGRPQIGWRAALGAARLASGPAGDSHKCRRKHKPQSR